MQRGIVYLKTLIMSFRNTGFNYDRPRPSATISHERRRVNFEALITLAAVIISSVFSYFSLQETRRQSKVATDQLKLSTAQFKEAQRQFYTERLDKSKMIAKGHYNILEIL